MKDFTFKALIVFIIVLVSGLILLPILRPDTDNVGGNGGNVGNYELLVDNELMDFVESTDMNEYNVLFDNLDYQIILVSIYSLEKNFIIVENMILNQVNQIINVPDILAIGSYTDYGISIFTFSFIGDLKITVWGVSK